MQINSWPEGDEVKRTNDLVIYTKLEIKAQGIKIIVYGFYLLDKLQVTFLSDVCYNDCPPHTGH